MSESDSTIPDGFRQIPGFPRYCISEDGTILSICGHVRGPDLLWSEARKIIPWTNRNGYQTVKLCGEGMSRKVHIHVLVLMAFIGPPPAGQECRHLDGNKTNNRISNLCWGTVAENHRDKILHGTSNQGERHYSTELTNDDVLEIRRRVANGERQGIVAKEFRVSVSAMSGIVRRITWKHI
jgi:hypothetical protein